MAVAQDARATRSRAVDGLVEGVRGGDARAVARARPEAPEHCSGIPPPERSSTRQFMENGKRIEMIDAGPC